MDIFTTIMSGQKDNMLDSIGQQFGLDADTSRKAGGLLMSAIAGGVQTNIKNRGGMEMLMGALSKGSHDQYMDQPEMLTQSSAVSEGNGILSHVLGSKENSRHIARQVGQTLGLDDSIMKKMLPLVATMAMGSLSKQVKGASGNDNPLMGMLDQDGDGDTDIGDILKVAGKFFK